MPVAFCPCPPLLVPEVAQGAAHELDDLRAHCDAVVRRLCGSADDSVTVLASGSQIERWGTDAGGTLRGFGVDVCAGGSQLVLDPMLTIGAWLLDRVGWEGERTYRTVRADSPWDPSAPVLLVGDGTAKRSDAAPGHIDQRAAAYDKSIAHALATGDPGVLADLDLRVAEQLWARGVPAMRSLGAGLVTARRTVRSARLLYDEAPYGVGYFVAEWRLGEDGQ